MVSILLQTQPRPICLLSVYLPTCTACTDIFKESLDYLDSTNNLFRFANDVLILGDMNADLGLGGGPMASTPINEQGKTSTYESEANSSISTIDHILCPSHVLSSLSSCHVIEEPSNNSDHFPITWHISIHLPFSPIHHILKTQPPTPTQPEEAHNA